MNIIKPHVDILPTSSSGDPTIIIHFIHDMSFYIKLLSFGGFTININNYKDDKNNIAFILPGWATLSQLRHLDDTDNTSVDMSNREEYELYCWKKICKISEELYMALLDSERIIPTIITNFFAKDIIVSGKRSDLIKFLLTNIEKSCFENDMETIGLLNKTFRLITKEKETL